MNDIATQVAAEIEKLEPSTSTSLEIGADVYFDAIKGMLNHSSRGVDVIYVASTVPAKAIISAMDLIGVDTGGVKFIDCISNMMTGQQSREENIILIESPTMLENIMLKVEFLRRKSNGRNVLVILDSINTLHIHNDWKIMGEFLHILVNSLRSRGAMILMLSIKEQQTQEVSTLLGLVSDKLVRFGGE
ncbi:MAG: hypothetical protein KIY12_00445 [Thermoplasmata archaeon]|uniref:KaiC-like domain-containing protein n=1 Tax=Candidatus Sysuiplasma superficiale TaxID=2823368 RepID=A0A8J7YMU2_9ARCH|nr:hypothetical protein [Candidatus Sysuiplasma superficiale]MBX8643193.1 hypothetical protein [Candidatus Sysuiplasma superficiale]MCL4346722.1 hypothetical protein [Candidatus Thermoplasmatota archaeon]